MTNEIDLFATRTQEVQTNIDVVADDMQSINQLHEEVTSTRVNNINVDDLIEIWLPMFMGWQDSKSHLTIAHWISFAGTELSRVDVLGRDGKVMFQVPPMYPDEAVVAVNRDTGVDEATADSLNNLLTGNIEVARARSDLGPLHETLSVLGERISPSAIQKHKVEWEQFYKNMGVWELTPEKIEAAKAMANGTSGTLYETEKAETIPLTGSPVTKPQKQEEFLDPNDFLFS